MKPMMQRPWQLWPMPASGTSTVGTPTGGVPSWRPPAIDWGSRMTGIFGNPETPPLRTPTTTGMSYPQARRAFARGYRPQ